MRKVKMKVRLYNIVIILFCLFFLAVLCSSLITGKNSIIKNLVSDCEVYTVDDLYKCYNEQQYVAVHAMQVLDTGYERIENDRTTAKFVIVNIDGHAMVSVMRDYEANRLFGDETGHILIRGKLEKFIKSEAKVSDSIEMQFKLAFKDEFTKEELETLFTSVQLNQYQGDKGMLIFFLFLDIAIIYWILKIIIKKIPTIITPNNYYLNSYISLKDEVKVNKIMEEINYCHYHYKKFYVTENFLVIKQGSKFQVADKDCIAWIYEKKFSFNFIPMSHYIVVYSFDRKRTLHVPVYGINGESIMNILMKECPNATFGYSSRLSKLWRENPNSFIRK